MLLEKTRNESSVTAKTAGIESSAKTRSVVSAATSASNSGVAHLPMKNRGPSMVLVIGRLRATQRTTALSSGFASASSS